MFFRTHKKDFASRGFTLLELVVVFSVLAAVSTVGIASFVSYSKSQTLQGTYLNLIQALNLARADALSQVKPAFCEGHTLQGYEVDLNTFSNPNSYTFSAKCDGISDPNPQTVSLPPNIAFNSTLTPQTSIFFPILSNTVLSCSGNNICVITIKGYNSCRAIIIDSLGGIQGDENC